MVPTSVNQRGELGSEAPQPPAAFFSRLSSFSRLILFDKRGTGLSDRSTGIPDLETRMDDIRAVMDAVESNHAAILGVSEGGPMTALFAATYPERTAAAVLYGRMASYFRSHDYPWGMTAEEWDEEIRKTAPKVGTPEWLDERQVAFAPSTTEDPGATRWWRKWVLTSSSPAAISRREASRRPDRSTQWRSSPPR
jgi:pimeloyl-ACP methyl ester carboxylesterase